MTNYELLKQKIVLGDTNLSEIGKGSLLKCLFTSNKFDLEEGIIYEYYEQTGYNNFEITVYNIEKYIGNFKEVFDNLGKEPMLNNVLNYWSKKTSIITATGFKNQLHYIYSEWDLSKPYLKDQSEELISWLLALS